MTTGTGAQVALIVAMAADRVIGRDNALPWRLSTDLRHFKALTMGCPVVMGRKTFESIGRPLPGRRNLVLSRSPARTIEGCEMVGTLDEALAIDVPRLFVIGGAQIYAQALPRATHLFVTQVAARIEGDTRFPDVAWEDFSLIDYSAHEPGPGDDHAFAFFEYRRRA